MFSQFGIGKLYRARPLGTRHHRCGLQKSTQHELWWRFIRFFFLSKDCGGMLCDSRFKWHAKYSTNLKKNYIFANENHPRFLYSILQWNGSGFIICSQSNKIASFYMEFDYSVLLTLYLNLYSGHGVNIISSSDVMTEPDWSHLSNIHTYYIIIIRSKCHLKNSEYLMVTKNASNLILENLYAECKIFSPKFQSNANVEWCLWTWSLLLIYVLSDVNGIS